MYGVIMPRLSHSGSKIAYVLSQKGKPFSVFSYNFETHETKRLFKAKKSVISFAFDWLADDKGVIVFEGSELSTIVFDKNNIIKRTLTVTPAISPYYIAVQSANSLFYSANKTQAFSLIKATNLFSDAPEYEALYKSDEDDYIIAEVINEKGPAHIFVSERSGSSQLWLSQNGLTKQLSNFTYEGKSNFAIGGLRVSSKQDRVLLRVNSDIAFFDVMSNKLYTIAEFKGRKILNYVWSKDNESIIYLERSGSESLFGQFNLLTRDTTILEDIKANKLISGADGTNYAITNNQLIKLSNKQNWELPKDARQAQIFAINGNYLYYSDAISRVARLNLEDKTVQDVHVDFKPIAFFISDNNHIFFTASKYKDMQIIQISWND
tara:strand:- start:120 stop:1256 length:1137 start_codon:yes stop_codon:yes gene_type:complete